MILNEISREPIRRAEVSLNLRREGIQMGGGQSTSAVSDTEGKFRVENLEPGTYFLSCRKQGMMMPRRGFGPTPAVIQVSEGQEIKGLRCTLQQQAVISGKVLDEDGEPIQGAQVQILAKRLLRGKSRWMSSGPPAQTNDRGEYRLIDLAPGKYVVFVSFWGQTPIAQAVQGRTAMGYVPVFYPGVQDNTQASLI